MEDFAVPLGEHARTRTLLGRKICHLVVVISLAVFFLPGRDLVVVVEIRSERRHPLELPSHSLLECFDLRISRSPYNRECCITLRQMHPRCVERIGKVGAARAPFFPSRTEHEVINGKLATAAEQIRQRLLPIRSFEDIFLLNFFPRQLAPQTAQFIAHPREFFFFCQELLACGQPFGRRHCFRGGFLHCRCRHCRYSFSFESLFSPFFLRRTFATSAVNPPVETTLPTTTPALAKHAGHILPPYS